MVAANDDALDCAEFTRSIGFEHMGVSDGAYVVEVELAERHMSRARRAHGGVLFSLLDTALGRGVIEQLPEGRGVATVEIKINYFRPVQSGRLSARGRLVNQSRRFAYAEGEIVTAEGKLVARATGTFVLTETVEQDERERL